MKNSWFDVSEHIALHKLKNSTLNQTAPINLRTVVILFMTSQNIHNHHFMCLLIQLRKAHGTNMLIPALDVGCFI